jgi:hypothetical protein
MRPEPDLKRTDPAAGGSPTPIVRAAGAGLNGARPPVTRRQRIAWIHADADPIQSGELRRLGVPALLSEGETRTCFFGSPEAVAVNGPFDLAVVPVAALSRLPLIAPHCASILIEVDALSVVEGASGLAALPALSNRIAGIVARAPRVVAWAGRLFGDTMPVWLIPDAAVRATELQAAALAFGLGDIPDADAVLPPGMDVWFAEPGDRIGDDEIQALVTHVETFGNLFLIGSSAVRQWIAQAGAEAPGADWSSARLGTALAGTGRCVLPGPDNYSLERRRALAVRSGAACPVHWSAKVGAHTPAGVGRQWREVIDGTIPGDRHIGGHQTVMIVLDLVQDLDIALPLIDHLQGRPDADVRIVVSTWLLRRSPRVGKELALRKIPVEACSRDALLAGSEPDLVGVSALVSPAESSLSAHERVHALFIRARMLNIPTVSMQHGVENVGLKQADFEDDRLESVASDHLLIWTRRELTTRCRVADLGPRRVAVGRLRRQGSAGRELTSAFAHYDSVVAVFENLHWNRYSAEWRRAFLNDLVGFARIHARVAILLKPHHGGLWSIRNTHRLSDWPGNLIIADPTDPYWEPYTANALIGLADLVITTPSTVALDAVEMRKPVAVAAYGLDLPAYAPLPLLEGLEDWQTFFDTARTGDHARRRALFADRTVDIGDAPARAGDYILAVAQERAAFRHRSGSEGTLHDEHDRHLRRG